MTNEELQQAIAWFENRLSATVMPGAREMFCIALSALRAQLECEKEHIGETTDMMPLTLDELREMDGEPVWCADGEEHSCYCLVNAESEDCIDSECGAWCFEFYGMTGDGENGLHNMGWRAYDHKQGGEQE